MWKLAFRALFIVAATVALLAGALTASALANNSTTATMTAQTFARTTVDSHVGDVPAPFGGGIFNAPTLPNAAFNSATRNPVCGVYTGGPPG
jgi:hypothetical protein